MCWHSTNFALSLQNTIIDGEGTFLTSNRGCDLILELLLAAQERIIMIQASCWAFPIGCHDYHYTPQEPQVLDPIASHSNLQRFWSPQLCVYSWEAALNTISPRSVAFAIGL